MKNPQGLSHLYEDLNALEADGLLRPEIEPLDPNVRTFASNDYLGLAARPAVCAPAGAGASRLITGERIEHRRLERAFAGWLGLEDALAFTSGYAANVGTLGALARPGDLIVSDVLNHASLIDGARLSRARVVIVPHLDLAAIAAALESRTERRAFVVVEGYYSMDADGPDLMRLRTLADVHDAVLIVDEAHSLGVLGPGGRGRCAEAGILPDVLVGTLGKAFGAQGAFVAGPAVLRSWLWNRARSFVFSTGLSPASAATALRSLAYVVEHPEVPVQVLELATRLRAGLARAAPHAQLLGFGHIVPIVLGEEAMGVARALRAQGFHASAVRPPTVPAGTSRLRLTVTALHDEAAIDDLVAALAATLR